MLFVGIDHIMFLQPGLEVVSNLNDSYSPGIPKIPQPELEIPNNLNGPYIICRGSAKVPQPGPVVVNRPNDLYAVCITETRPDSYLGPLASMGRRSSEPIFLKEISCTLGHILI